MTRKILLGNKALEFINNLERDDIKDFQPNIGGLFESETPGVYVAFDTTTGETFIEETSTT